MTWIFYRFNFTCRNICKNITILHYFRQSFAERITDAINFATHDTNLLDLEIIRRDQIWFAEKDKVESTDIYSLVEFKDEDGKKVRNDRDIKRDYIRGRYGAIPFIGE